MFSIKPMPVLTFPDAARFSIWVEKSKGCWEWQGKISAQGYGVFYLNGGEAFQAHRVAYAIEHGAVPGDLLIDHRCQNKTCVRPSHLRPATIKQNRENLGPPKAASGYRGVFRSGDRWFASVTHNGVNHRLGTFDTPEEAHEAAHAKRLELYTHYQ